VADDLDGHGSGDTDGRARMRGHGCVHGFGTVADALDLLTARHLR
jgi:hypothetical protein